MRLAVWAAASIMGACSLCSDVFFILRAVHFRNTHFSAVVWGVLEARTESSVDSGVAGDALN